MAGEWAGMGLGRVWGGMGMGQPSRWVCSVSGFGFWLVLGDKVAGGLELKPPFFRDIPPPRLHHPSHRTANPPMPPTLPPPTWSPDQQRCCRPLRLGAPRNKGAMSGNASRPWRRPTKFAHLPPTWSPDKKKGCQWRKRLPDLRPRTIPQFFKLPMKRPLHRPVATDQGVPIHLSIAQRGSKKGGCSIISST